MHKRMTIIPVLLKLYCISSMNEIFVFIHQMAVLL